MSKKGGYMLGIGLGLMAILCAAGFIVGGGLFMHHGMHEIQKKDQPVMERNHDHGKTSEPLPQNLDVDQEAEVEKTVDP
jgi:hypothetical protein